jgi:hypothetical protein
MCASLSFSGKHLGLTGGGQTNGPGKPGHNSSHSPKKPRTDWALGLSVAYDAELLEASHFCCCKIPRVLRGSSFFFRDQHHIPLAFFARARSQDMSVIRMACHDLVGDRAADSSGCRQSSTWRYGPCEQGILVRAGQPVRRSAHRSDAPGACSGAQT